MMNHRKSAMGKSHDFGISSNGKGDKSRVTNQSAYAANFDEINWGQKPIKPAEVYAEVDSEWPPSSASPTTDIVRE